MWTKKERKRKMVHYTKEQEKWLQEKSTMTKYQSKTGRVRNRKIRDAFEKHFGVTRSRQGIGYKIWALKGGRVKKSKHITLMPTISSLNMGQVELKLKEMLVDIKMIREFAEGK